MSVRPLLFSLIALLGVGLMGARKNNTKPVAFDAGGGVGKRLFVVPIEGTIDLGLAPFIERVVAQGTANDVIMLRIKTFGGRVDAAVRIRDALLDARAKTVAYIDHRAISAGALIALACDTIIMSQGASIGAATPVQQGDGGKMQATSEKVVSYMRAEMRATAEAKGRRPDIAEAMVDRDITIKNISEKGKLLTLTGKRAKELGFIDATVDHFDAAITLLNLEGAKRQALETHWAERLARILTDPAISSMLMTFGFIGLLMEFYTPGFGIGGGIGALCLALFFFGQHAANLAGAEELLLFGLGLGFIVLEVFVIPGFGIAGIMGGGLVLAALVLSMIELNIPWDVSFELGYTQEAFSYAVIRLAISMLALLVAGILMAKYLPGSFAVKWLVFKVGSESGDTADLGAETPGASLPKSYAYLLNQQGITRSTLRPTGIVDFNGERVDVITSGDFIDPGVQVEVIQVEGHRIVVRAIAATVS